RDAIGERIFRLQRVDECMLCPITGDHGKAAEDKWQNKNDERCAEIEMAKHNENTIKTQFSGDETKKHFPASSSRKVDRNIDERSEKESQEIFQPASKAIAFVSHGRTQIGFEIFFNMVHPDMMDEIRLRRFAEQWPENPDNNMIQKPVLFAEKRPVADI